MSTPLAERIRKAIELAHATSTRDPGRTEENTQALIAKLALGYLAAVSGMHHEEYLLLLRPPIPPPVVLPAIPLRSDRDAVGPEDEAEHRR